MNCLVDVCVCQVFISVGMSKCMCVQVVSVYWFLCVCEVDVVTGCDLRPAGVN